jgi:hypothetical protein
MKIALARALLVRSVGGTGVHSVASRLRTCRQSYEVRVCGRRFAHDLAITRRRIRSVEDRTAPTRDVLVAPQSCASNFSPGGVRRERRSDRGYDLCAWSMKACRQVASRRLNSPVRSQTCRRTY